MPAPPKKPGLAIGVMIGRPKPGKDLEEPDSLESGPPKPKMNGAAPKPDDAGGGGQIADPSEVGFHDGSEVCTNCVHYDSGSNNCERWNFDVGENPHGAYCHAFKQGSDQEQGEQSSDAGEENEQDSQYQ